MTPDDELTYGGVSTVEEKINVAHECLRRGSLGANEDIPRCQQFVDWNLLSQTPQAAALSFSKVISVQLNRWAIGKERRPAVDTWRPCLLLNKCAHTENACSARFPKLRPRLTDNQSSLHDRPRIMSPLPHHSFLSPCIDLCYQHWLVGRGRYWLVRARSEDTVPSMESTDLTWSPVHTPFPRINTYMYHQH